MSTKKLIVLIHGAGVGAFVWGELRPLLNFQTLTINFPNRKPSEASNSNLSFEDYVSEVIKQIQKADFDELVIATSSIGGLIGLRVAEFFGSKVIGFVGVASAIPSGKNSFVSCLPFPQSLILPLILKIAGTEPPKKAIEESLCSDLTRVKKDLIIANFTPESRFLYTQKCQAKIPNCKKLYVKLTADKEFSDSMQDQMAKNLGAEQIIELDSGHLAMLSRPRKLAEILNSFCEKL